MDESQQKGLQSRAEDRLWEYLRGELEKMGQGESALYLRHFLMARAGEPDLRGELALVPFEMFHRVSDYSLKMDAMDGQVMGWHFELLAENPGQEIPADQALKAAQVETDPPPGAVLTVSEYEQIGDTPVFVARWEHEVEGIPVERDYLHVLVNGKSGRPFSVHKKWHTLEFNPQER